MAKSITITRVFDAPVELVWKMWSEPEMMKQWWGPKKFSCPICTIDFRVGGKFLSCMRGKPTPEAPEQDFWSTGTYKEIIPLKKIVATDSFADKDGNVVSASQYGLEGFPLELLVTVLFEVKNGKTQMTLTHEGLENVDEKFVEGMDQGWNESFDKIVKRLKQ